MKNKPSTNRANRDAGGRFAAGNAGGPGNPHARKVAKLRAALLQAVKPADLRGVVEKLLGSAKAGDVQAAKLIIDRVLGPPLPSDIIDRLESLENFLRESEK